MSNGLPPARRRLSEDDVPATDRMQRPSSEAVAQVTQGAKLVCTAGPKSGAEFALIGEELVIGRATECAISIPDTSVSRKHTLLKKVPGGWAASDMGSGNGTLVNGEPIAEETILRNGDLVTLGDTQLSFVDLENSTSRRPIPTRRTGGGDAPAVRARPVTRRHSRGAPVIDPETQAKRKKQMLIGAAGLVVLLIGGGVGWKVKRTFDAERGAAQAAEEAKRLKAATVFQDGKNLANQGDWSAAKAKFLEAQEIFPTLLGLAEYIEQSDRESQNQERLASAEAAMGERRLGDAAEQLAQVNTRHYVIEKKHTLLKKQLEEAFAAKLSDARALLESSPNDVDKMRELEALTDDLLRANKDSRDAAELNRQAKGRIEELTRVRGPGPKPEARPWADAVSRFKQGDLSGALSLANDCATRKECRDLLAKLNTYADKHKRVETLAVKELEEMLRLDEEIGGGRSPLAKPAATRYSGQQYKLASGYKASGDLGKAMDHVNKTLWAEPGHAGAQAIKVELTQQANDLYVQAYAASQSNPEEGIKQFRDLLKIVPKNDKLYEKIQKRIDALLQQQ